MPDSLSKHLRFPVILGPTACGKSQLAHPLSKRFGLEMISVDSMKVYRGLNIGTAKPSPSETAEVPCHMIDILGPGESFNTADYLRRVCALLEGACQEGKKMLLEGGTALYFKALFEGMFEGPTADWQLREQFMQRAEAEGVEVLHEELKTVDPQAASRIGPEDLRRIIRALEVHRLTGKPISTLQMEETRPAGFQFAIVGLRRQRAELVEWIEKRVDQMFEAGLVQEVERLLARGPLSREASQALGYKEVIAYLQGDCTFEQCREQVKIGTRQFSRRQMNWFKRFKNVQWIDVVGGITAQIEDQAARLLGLL